MGTSAWVNSAQVSFPAPDPVTEVRAVHRGNSLEVSWDAPARATHYDVTTVWWWERQGGVESGGREPGDHL